MDSEISMTLKIMLSRQRGNRFADTILEAAARLGPEPTLGIDIRERRKYHRTVSAWFDNTGSGRCGPPIKNGYPGLLGLLLTGLTLWSAAGEEAGETGSGETGLPVHGLHLSAPSKADIDTALEFVRQDLPGVGVNVLVLEFDYNYDFQSRPEFSDSEALGRAELHRLVLACREQSIELIPQINCLGHQSWSSRNGRLLQLHPEFDETPGKYPENEGIYCRSYCPLHPEVHTVLFDLIDELVRDCEARAFHVGMDEVFILADPDCPRCAVKEPAEIFAGEVRTLHDHLAELGCRMWMWGDRFLDADTTGLGKWEASANGTAKAIGHVPHDVVICDWHYNRAAETPRYFAERGFDVVACPWRKEDVALEQLAHLRKWRDTDRAASRHILGMLQTTWCGFRPFVQAYRALEAGEESPSTRNATESAQCFLASARTWQKTPAMKSSPPNE